MKSSALTLLCLLLLTNVGCGQKPAPKPQQVPTDKVVKTDAEWKQQLSPEAYDVLRQKGTERAGTGALLKNKDYGIYKCAGCGFELFSSEAKYDSGCGWPSFYEPIDENAIAEAPDNSYGWNRTEVLCPRCDGHLGHVFNDGPKPTGLRYCINSVSITFEKSTR